MRKSVLTPLALWFAMPVYGLAVEPFTTPNLSPPILIYGAPSWTLASKPTAGLNVALTSAVASHFSLDSNSTDRMLLDGETRHLHLGLRRRVAEHWLVGLDLGWVQHTSGNLDGFIDSWHSAFGLPDGGRDQRLQDQIEFSFVNGGATVFELTEGVSGIGDSRVGVGRIVGADANWLLWGELKLPTGSARRLTGSGSIDGTLSLTHHGSILWPSRTLDWYWGVAATRLGTPDLMAPARDWVTAAMAGISVGVWPKVAFVAQLEATSPYYRGNLDQVSNAALPLTLGARVQVGDKAWLDFAVVEDVSVDASPDVTFIINLKFSQ